MRDCARPCALATLQPPLFLFTELRWKVRQWAQQCGVGSVIKGQSRTDWWSPTGEKSAPCRLLISGPLWPGGWWGVVQTRAQWPGGRWCGQALEQSGPPRHQASHGGSHSHPQATVTSCTGQPAALIVPGCGGECRPATASVSDRKYSH